jgi:hypothetical protein
LTGQLDANLNFSIHQRGLVVPKFSKLSRRASYSQNLTLQFIYSDEICHFTYISQLLEISLAPTSKAPSQTPKLKKDIANNFPSQLGGIFKKLHYVTTQEKKRKIVQVLPDISKREKKELQTVVITGYLIQYNLFFIFQVGISNTSKRTEAIQRFLLNLQFRFLDLFQCN